MEQMKFEMGDLQQNAPKRMRKRRPPRKKARGLLLVILLVLAAVAAFVRPAPESCLYAGGKGRERLRQALSVQR